MFFDFISLRSSLIFSTFPRGQKVVSFFAFETISHLTSMHHCKMDPGQFRIGGVQTSCRAWVGVQATAVRDMSGICYGYVREMSEICQGMIRCYRDCQSLRNDSKHTNIQKCLYLSTDFRAQSSQI